MNDIYKLLGKPKLNVLHKLISILIFLVFFHSLGQTKVPDISIKSSSGNLINVKDFTKDKIVILSFWATWCAPCINELNNINEVYSIWQKETGVTLVAVSIDDTRSISRVLPLSNGYDWNYQILYDNNEDLKRAFNIYSIPYTIAINKGEVFYRHSGYKEGDETILIKKVKDHIRRTN
ncbi:TlpA family protein disulfide reductase [Flavobacteriaceae bacterium LMO-SS05]